MGNRTYKIGNGSQTNTSESEVYVDVSLDSAIKDDGYRIQKSVNIRAVQNSLDNIFRWIPGERILNPEFGSKLRLLLYEGITDRNRERIAGEIRSSVLKFDPRVNVTKITDVGSNAETEDNTVQIEIEYTINGLEDEVFHKQYIFDMNSAY